jgi:hypothetical protein
LSTAQSNRKFCERHSCFDRNKFFYIVENKEALKNFKGHSQDVGQAKFAENIHASPFNEDRSNENTFSLIHLDSTFCAANFSFAQLAKGKKSRP